LDTPVNIFVAGFIGSPAMNLVPGVARINGGAPAWSSWRYPFAAAHLGPRERRPVRAVWHAPRHVRRLAASAGKSLSSSRREPTRNSSAASMAWS
jgi:ABC-type sugar transport system ATPase subunit